MLYSGCCRSYYVLSSQLLLSKEIFRKYSSCNYINTFDDDDYDDDDDDDEKMMLIMMMMPVVIMMMIVVMMKMVMMMVMIMIMIQFNSIQKNFIAL